MLCTLLLMFYYRLYVKMKIYNDLWNTKLFYLMDVNKIQFNTLMHKKYLKMQILLTLCLPWPVAKMEGLYLGFSTHVEVSNFPKRQDTHCIGCVSVGAVKRVCVSRMLEVIFNIYWSVSTIEEKSYMRKHFIERDVNLWCPHYFLPIQKKSLLETKMLGIKKIKSQYYSFLRTIHACPK